MAGINEETLVWLLSPVPVNRNNHVDEIETAVYELR